jgi:integrase
VVFLDSLGENSAQSPCNGRLHHTGELCLCQLHGTAVQSRPARWALQDALKGLGITFDQARADGMHLLRHSSGSIVYRHTGGDVKQTQAWLGHGNSRVTLDTYTHLANDEEQKTAQRLETAIFAP